MNNDNAEHTKGPWRVDLNPYDNEWRVYSDGEDCPVINSLFKPYSGVGEANARLIAAAPELLEALAGLLKHAPLPKGIRKDFSYILYLEAARTAIAKAEGRNA